MPLLSDTNTLTNVYSYKAFKELYENNVSTFSFLLKTASSLSGDNINFQKDYIFQEENYVGLNLVKSDPKMEVIILVAIMFLVLTQLQRYQ